MKQVELSLIRAMLRDVIATSGNKGSDVRVVMSIGDPTIGSRLSITSNQEVNGLLDLLQQAMPSLHTGILSFSDADWQQFEDLYAQRVMQPVFA